MCRCPCFSCSNPAPPAGRSCWRPTYDVLFGSRILTKTSVICNAVFIVVILASLAVVLVDSLQSVKDDATTANILNYVELAFSILFTAEYFVRLVCVRQCVLYMISFMGIVDFLSAVPPLFALLFSPLSTLILLRVLKLTRIFTLFESVGVFRAYHEMLRNVNQNTLKMVVFIVGFWSISVVLGGFMFVLESAENPGFDNMFKAVYWAVVTLTTVGYGDAVPETPAGKVLAAITMTMGYTFVVLGLRQFYDSWKPFQQSADTSLDRNSHSEPRNSSRRLAEDVALAEAAATFADDAAESKSDNGQDEVGRQRGCCDRYQGYARFMAIGALLHVLVTKIALGGAGWQTAALVTGLNDTSLVYAFAAGLGDSCGVFLGNAILYATLLCCLRRDRRPSCQKVITVGLTLSAGAMLSGFVWQPIVNVMEASKADFNVAMAVTGLLCGSCFLFGTTCAKLGFDYCSPSGQRKCMCPSGQEFVRDATLAFGVMGSTAVFVGTCSGWHGNWLQSLVGERNGTEVADIGMASFATIVGFAMVTLPLLLVVPPQWMWTYEPPPKRRSVPAL